MSDAERVRTVVITGAGSGIGRAAAIRIGAEGTRILALDRDGQSAKETADAVEAAGGRGLAAACDVTDESALEAAIGEVDRVEALVNSAGIFGEKRVEEITGDDLRRMYEVNAIGLFNACRAALARMPDGGRIINVASRAYLGSRDHAHYVASKAAVVGLTRTLAIDLAPRQIVVNAIAPGAVRTPMLTSLPEERLGRLAASYPQGRLIEAEDVAHAIAFFADPATRSITGQVLIIDGGRSLGLSGA
ncbi:MAG TPA: SDR family NAD(P)-dependent oxidoreductase [Solirubrobacteraceae bacterium]|nr:SDR family NAD(P)-dependent oxidoreductase [Solirubrobacteraceae bacterium]